VIPADRRRGRARSGRRLGARSVPWLAAGPATATAARGAGGCRRLRVRLETQPIAAAAGLSPG